MADVVRVLSHHDPKRVEAAAQIILNQLRDAPAKLVAYGAARAIPSLVDALRAHPDHTGVQERICRALCNLCAQNWDNKVSSLFLNEFSFDRMTVWCVIQIAIAIREAGGIDLILLASKNHIANVGVQRAVSGALQNVSNCESNKVSS